MDSSSGASNISSLFSQRLLDSGRARAETPANMHLSQVIGSQSSMSSLAPVGESSLEEEGQDLESFLNQ